MIFSSTSLLLRETLAEFPNLSIWSSSWGSCQPLILETEGSRATGAYALGLSWVPSSIRSKIVGEAGSGHVVTMTAARLRSNGEQQIFIEDSDGILTGWHGLEVMSLIRGYIWVQLP